MPSIKVSDRADVVHTVPIGGALTLMEAIRDAGVGDMLALCGGCCSCSTCHIYVADDFLSILPAAEEPEDDLLDGLESRRPNSRLACQIELAADHDGMAVTIAPEE